MPDFEVRKSGPGSFSLLKLSICCWGIAEALTASSKRVMVSASATLSSFLVKMRATPSLDPATISPVSWQTATDQTDIAGTVMVCTHSKPFHIRIDRSSPELTSSPVGNALRLYTKESCP